MLDCSIDRRYAKFAWPDDDLIARPKRTGSGDADLIEISAGDRTKILNINSLGKLEKPSVGFRNLPVPDAYLILIATSDMTRKCSDDGFMFAVLKCKGKIKMGYIVLDDFTHEIELTTEMKKKILNLQADTNDKTE